MGFEKRGLSGTWISIIIVLAVFVLAIVVFNLVGKEEVAEPDPVAVQCSFACDTGQKTSFCDIKRKVTDTLGLTCNELSTNSQYSQYNVQTCPSISCSAAPQGNSQIAPDQTCSGLDGTWETPTPSGTCPTKEGFFARIRTAEDSPPTTGQVCCYYYQ